MIQLQLFAIRALRQLPPVLWRVLAALLSAGLSLALRQEVFPNTPAAAAVAGWVLAGGGVLLLPLGSWWLWRVAAVVEQPGWRLLWRLGATIASVLTGGLLLGLGLLGLAVLL